MAYNPVNPNGQATSANSSPVVIASDQSAINTNVQNLVSNVISTGNSTTAQLAGSGVFTGAWENVSSYSTIVITGYTDQNSAANGAVVQFSNNNGTTILRESFTTVTAPNYGFPVVFPVEAQYFRLVYTNGTTATTQFAIQTIYHASSVTPTQLVLGAAISQNDLANLTRAVIGGQMPSGAYANVPLDTYGNLNISLAEAPAYVPIKALDAGQTTQWSVYTTVGQIVTSPLANRKSITIKASNSNTISGVSYLLYVGFSSSLATTDGFELGPGQAISLDIDNTVNLYAIAQSGAPTLNISCIEVAG